MEFHCEVYNNFVWTERIPKFLEVSLLHEEISKNTFMLLTTEEIFIYWIYVYIIRRIKDNLFELHIMCVKVYFYGYLLTK